MAKTVEISWDICFIESKLLSGEVINLDCFTPAQNDWGCDEFVEAWMLDERSIFPELVRKNSLPASKQMSYLKQNKEDLGPVNQCQAETDTKKFIEYLKYN